MVSFTLQVQIQLNDPGCNDFVLPRNKLETQISRITAEALRKKKK